MQIYILSGKNRNWYRNRKKNWYRPITSWNQTFKAKLNNLRKITDLCRSQTWKLIKIIVPNRGTPPHHRLSPLPLPGGPKKRWGGAANAKIITLKATNYKDFYQNVKSELCRKMIMHHWTRGSFPIIWYSYIPKGR